MKLNVIKKLKVISNNDGGIDYFVGDIHGNYSLLIEQLKQLSFDFKNDRLFAIGNIIDCGNESEKCLELLIEPWFHSTLGMHEYLFLQSFETPELLQNLIMNGGGWMYKWLNKPETLVAWAHLIRIKMPLTMNVITKYGNITIFHSGESELLEELENKIMEKPLFFSNKLHVNTLQSTGMLSIMSADEIIRVISTNDRKRINRID